MTFKTNQQLLDENAVSHKDFTNYYIQNINIKKGINLAFDSFAERVEFYKKYRYKPTDDFLSGYPQHMHDVVKSEIPDVYDKWIKYKPVKFWNDWLFNYCFSDVIE